MAKLRAKVRLIEAHDLLAPVYDWFTDGFDTARRELQFDPVSMY